MGRQTRVKLSEEVIIKQPADVEEAGEWHILPVEQAIETRGRHSKLFGKLMNCLAAFIDLFFDYLG